jgi:hypothetical protein
MPAPLSNWDQLKTQCESSACNIANGCTIVLSEGFNMGSFTGEICFNLKDITVWGQGGVLDALGGERFFKGSGAGSSLKLHDVVLQNGGSDNVSSRDPYVEIHDSPSKQHCLICK